jgi:hypothetical protein
MLICPEHVFWVKEANSILVVDEQRAEAVVLQGLECAVWSWISLAYPYPDLVRFLAETLDQPAETAQRSLDALLGRWVHAGLLEEKVAGGG